MLTKEIKLFRFDELSENAQEKAINRYKDEKDFYFCFAVNFKSIEYFAEQILNSKIKKYSIHPYYHSYIEYDKSFLTDEIMDLKGLRAFKWIYNNIIDNCFNGKCFSTDGKYNYKFRYSKIIENLEDCIFTGACSDFYITDILRDLLENKIDCGLTVEKLIKDIFDNWVKKTKEDMEYEDSEEFAKSVLDNGEEIYLENGKLFKY